MENSDNDKFTKSKLLSIRKSWSSPDMSKGKTWEYDGIPSGIEGWDTYDNVMREGLFSLGCKTFEDLIVKLTSDLGRKPNVIDLMGGAYFLDNPNITNTLTGIRIHDKDADFLEVHATNSKKIGERYRKIIGSPNRQVIEADILSNKGWNIIANSNLPKADLLVCRPVGPFDIRHSLPGVDDKPAEFAGLYKSLFSRMLNIVNKDGGIIFTEIPDPYTNIEIEKFFVGIDKTAGSSSTVFTVPDKDYSWSGYKRRYAVVRF